MNWIYRLLIVLVSGTVFNVWLLRFSQATPYRGADAANLQSRVFGLWQQMRLYFYLIGGVKLLAALALLLGLKFKQTVRPAATTIAVLMLGAIAMHFKVADPWWKVYLPSSCWPWAWVSLGCKAKPKFYVSIASISSAIAFLDVFLWHEK